MTRSMHDMPFGAAPRPDGGCRFRLWAPALDRLGLVLEGGGVPATHDVPAIGDGWFELTLPDIGAGARYRYAVGEGLCVPDPASRAQPDGVHGPSAVVDPRAWHWNDAEWRGRAWAEAVLYELHVGTFTRGGTYDGVRGKLRYLAELGVTAVELMPLSAPAGRRNWGYDGVLPFAPATAYGPPEALKALIDAAHAEGLMMFVDVVYNHFGPEGNYLHRYAPSFFTGRYETPWGTALDFEASGRAVREFFIHNALYWLDEYHFDGLRLDAVHAIFDRSDPHILVELAERVRARFADGRQIHLVLENDDNAARYLARDDAGRPRWYTAQWNDDLHHALHVATTGEAEGYYADYAADPVAHVGRCLAEGFAWQGEPSSYRGGETRGERSAGLPPTAFIGFLQNHDQVGNRARGERIARLTSPAALRAAMSILLLAPSPPLLFMGEEWGATQPFLFFCDFAGELADAVREGRRREFARFPQFRDAAARESIPDPATFDAFAASTLDWAATEREAGREWLAFYRHLLALRQTEMVPFAGHCDAAPRRSRHGERGLRIVWPFAGRQLELRANLGATEVAGLPASPAGARILAATTAATDLSPDHDRLAPWTVVWLVDDESGRA